MVASVGPLMSGCWQVGLFPEDDPCRDNSPTSDTSSIFVDWSDDTHLGLTASDVWENVEPLWRQVFLEWQGDGAESLVRGEAVRVRLVPDAVRTLEWELPDQASYEAVPLGPLRDGAYLVGDIIQFEGLASYELMTTEGVARFEDVFHLFVHSLDPGEMLLVTGAGGACPVDEPANLIWNDMTDAQKSLCVPTANDRNLRVDGFSLHLQGPLDGLLMGASITGKQKNGPVGGRYTCVTGVNGWRAEEE